MSFDRAALARVSGSAVDGLVAAARALESASNALVPDLSGALQASSEVSVDRGGKVAAVSYDDPGAALQHEALDFRHDDGQAKFLEQPLTSGADNLLDEVADGLRSVLR